MAISRARINALMAASRAYSRDTDTYVTIEEKCDYGTSRLELEVNWGALGATSPEQAVKFAEAVKLMAKTAEEINRLELSFDWDAADPLINSKARYDLYVADLINYFKEGRTAKIARFMEDGNM